MFGSLKDVCSPVITVCKADELVCRRSLDTSVHNLCLLPIWGGKGRLLWLSYRRQWRWTVFAGTKVAVVVNATAASQCEWWERTEAWLQQGWESKTGSRWDSVPNSSIHRNPMSPTLRCLYVCSSSNQYLHVYVFVQCWKNCVQSCWKVTICINTAEEKKLRR